MVFSQQGEETQLRTFTTAAIGNFEEVLFNRSFAMNEDPQVVAFQVGVCSLNGSYLYPAIKIPFILYAITDPHPLPRHNSVEL